MWLFRLGQKKRLVRATFENHQKRPILNGVAAFFGGRAARQRTASLHQVYCSNTRFEIVPWSVFSRSMYTPEES